MVYGNDRIRREILPNVDNATESLVNPASMNITLGDTILVPVKKKGGIQLGDEIEYNRHYFGECWSDTYSILPGQFLLATTEQYIRIPKNCAAFVQGRSSIGRAGLSIQNAGFVDPGFEGEITLELKNESPNVIKLRKGYPVGQLVFFECDGVSDTYHGKYQGQTGATGSRMYMDEIGKEDEE